MTKSLAYPTDTSDLPRHLKILIINPNTSMHMTHALEPVINALGYGNITFHYFTCPPPGIQSINSPTDAAESAKLCLPALLRLLSSHDAFLVCCYSEHPLVQMLRTECDRLPTSEGPRKYVTGIFEASVSASLNLTGAVGPKAGFGIVSTGKVWEEALAKGVRDYVGGESARFIGCETTGLNAGELHELPPQEVRGRMMEATKRLVRKGGERGIGLRAICLGCAGMVGLEEAVREALREELGEVEGGKVAVVDGVVAGVGELVTLARGGF